MGLPFKACRAPLLRWVYEPPKKPIPVARRPLPTISDTGMSHWCLLFFLFVVVCDAQVRASP